MSGFNDKEWYSKNLVPPIIEEEQEMARKPLKKSEKQKRRKERCKNSEKCRPLRSVKKFEM